MAHTADAIKAAIQALADASSSALRKVLLGDPAGTDVLYPDEEGYSMFGQAEERGQAWEEGLIPGVVEGLGFELDKSAIAWAKVSTGASGVAPTVLGSAYVTSVSKDEGAASLTINFSTAYANANFCVKCSSNIACFPLLSGQTTSSATFTFFDTAGATIAPNSHTVMLLAVGQR